MSRASFLGLLIVALVLGGLISLHGSWLALSIPLFLYWEYALLFAPGDLELDVERELSADRVGPGTVVRVHLRLHNKAGYLEEVCLYDKVPDGLEIVKGENYHFLSLPTKGVFEFEYQVQGKRGGYTFDSLTAEAGDLLGLLRLKKEVRTHGQLFILPTIARIRDVPIRPRRTRVYAGTIPARVGGPGVEFFGVRAYNPGDSTRWINWRASARHMDELFTVEFQQERVADVAIVLDGRERSDVRVEGHSLFEFSVVAAGTLADALLHQGNRVGLLVYSQYLHWTLPGYGKLQRERILHALSRAAPGASQIFEGLQYLPARLFPLQSQIVLVSPLLEDDYSTLVQLRARGYQVMVVSPDPIVFEQDYLLRSRSSSLVSDVLLSARIIRMERTLMLSRVRRAGIKVIEWDVSLPFDEMTRIAFRRAGRIWSQG
jgi:uncharacterized protein (DUF58 family)